MLAVTGVTHVVVALGLNDIGLPIVVGIPSEVVSADAIITGLRQLIERAHDKGLTIVGATITPVGSSTFPGFFTPENEAKRQAVNQWIRTSHAFDGVIDFDKVVRDPDQPNQLRPSYNSGDGVHPNDTGYLAMANAIDLSRSSGSAPLTRRRPRHARRPAPQHRARRQQLSCGITPR